MPPPVRQKTELFQRVGEWAVSSWGLLARVIPDRYHPIEGFVFPWGRGFEFSEETPVDRPSVSLELEKMLTGFFHDEPLSQAYSRNRWLIVAPGRLFLVLPTRTQNEEEEWLHAAQEIERLDAIAQGYKDRQNGKQIASKKYEIERHKVIASAKVQDPRTRKNRRPKEKHWGKRKPQRKKYLEKRAEKINMRSTYDFLERLLRIMVLVRGSFQLPTSI